MERERREGEFFLDYQRSVWQHYPDGDELIMAAAKAQPNAEDKKRPNTAGRIAKLKRLRLFCQMRDEVRSILDLQAEHTDEAIAGLEEPPWAKHQRRLDELYEQFVAQFQAINRVEMRRFGRPNLDGEFTTHRTRPNLKDFREDPDAYLVAAIEIYNEHTGTHHKSDIFTKRVIAARGVEPEFNTTRAALMYCVGERGVIDLDYIATLMEKSTGDVLQELIESNSIFQNPQTGNWELAEKYLSGNMQDKLALAKEAAETEPFYASNIEALTKALPIPLKPEDIDINLGMHWIPIDIIKQFAEEVLEVGGPTIHYVPETHTWFATGDGSTRDAAEQFGTPDASPIHILRASLNNKPVNPEGRDMLDRTAATILAREKQIILEERFKTWAWEDTERAERLAELYNQQFNSTVLREYDGAHLAFPGQSLAVSLRPHQLNAVWRNTEYGNTLYGHEVGAGKTWAAATAAMEMRRLDRVQKPCFVVPNHLLDQWARDFKLLYPNAKLLVLSDDQFREQGKELLGAAKLEKFVSRAANQDCDAIILTQSNFDRLPATPEARLEILLQEMNLAHTLQERHAREGDPELERYFNNVYRHKSKKLQKFLDGIDPDMEIEDVPEASNDLSAEENSADASTQNLGEKTWQRDDDDDDDDIDANTTRTIDRLMATPIASAVWQPYLEKMREQEACKFFGTDHPTKPRPYFEDTGIDYLFVDEGQDYKNLGITSRLEGLGTEPSNKALSLYAKVHQLRKHNPEYNLSIMTGTPVSNALSELYNLQRYMQEPLLESMGIHNFDAWVAMFANSISSIEMSPEGGSYRVVSRLARYKNVPELQRMFLQFADIVTGEMLNLPKPALKNGKHTIINVPRGAALKDYIDTLGDRADAVRDGRVKSHEDNMLKITNNGRLAALHPRLVGLTTEPGFKGKIDYLADEVASRYEQYKGNVYKDVHGRNEPIKGALQMVFCDISTPKPGRSFSAYDEIKRQLIQRGIPESKIRFIHDYKSNEKKEELFEDCRAGKVSVLVGTTQKLGTGTNVQKRLIAQHHLDAPWRPGDIDQRDGRILRQGNQNEEVDILRYVVEGSFDTYMWQTLERKAKFIAQIMRGDMSMRHLDDNDTNALSYAEVKAIASGDPLIREKAGVDNDFARLQRLKMAHEQGLERERRGILFAEYNIRELEKNIDWLRLTVETIEKADPNLYPFVLAKAPPQPNDEASRMAIGRELRSIFRELSADARERTMGASKVLGTVYGYTATAEIKHEMRVVDRSDKTPDQQKAEAVKSKNKLKSPLPPPPTTRIQHTYTMQLTLNDPSGTSVPIYLTDLVEPNDVKEGSPTDRFSPIIVKPDDSIPEKILDRIRQLQQRSAQDVARIEALRASIERFNATLSSGSFDQQLEYERIFARKQEIDALLEVNAAQKIAAKKPSKKSGAGAGGTIGDETPENTISNAMLPDRVISRHGRVHVPY